MVTKPYLKPAYLPTYVTVVTVMAVVTAVTVVKVVAVETVETKTNFSPNNFFHQKTLFTKKISQFLFFKKKIH